MARTQLRVDRANAVLDAAARSGLREQAEIDREAAATRRNNGYSF
ncbi:hypothetical protein [Amycolatopsis sp. NPDC059021]